MLEFEQFLTRGTNTEQNVFGHEEISEADRPHYERAVEATRGKVLMLRVESPRLDAYYALLPKSVTLMTEGEYPEIEGDKIQAGHTLYLFSGTPTEIMRMRESVDRQRSLSKRNQPTKLT